VTRLPIPEAMTKPTLPLTRPAWVLTGPTGSGKSEFALRLAETHGAEIIAMDSMTLYRGMDVGTAKSTAEERRRVPHHLIDELEAWESANVAWWLGRAAECCRDIESRGRQVLFVGGTPLYLKALLHGLFEGPPADPAIRERLEAEARRDGAGLHRRLAEVDAPTAARLHPNDVRRIVRALEVWETTGRPISDWQREWEQEPASDMLRCWWIDRPRDELCTRINSRVERMMAAGWPDEVQRLLASPKPLSRQASQALGYAEVREYVEGRADRQATIELIQLRSRQFAKRQRTWFRQLRPLALVPVSGNRWPDVTIWPDFPCTTTDKIV
jgi:tRNA dimethylallyltransferase